MPKYPKNKKRKQPLRPSRGPERPPDRADRRGTSDEPSSRRPTLGRTESPQSGEYSVRSVGGNGREMVLLHRSPVLPLTIYSSVLRCQFQLDLPAHVPVLCSVIIVTISCKKSMFIRV